MRRFGRQCRGQGKVFVHLVRQTETHLLRTGASVATLAQAAQAQVQTAPELTEDQQARWDVTLTLALEAHQQIVRQSRRLTHGKPLTQGKIVNAYDPTLAPICKGKSNCPTQFGRKPGILGEPATGFIFAARLPVGNPSDVSYVEPLVDQAQTACAKVTTRPAPAIHSLAGDLAVNDTALREQLHRRDILTVGIPHTVEPLTPTPSPEIIDAALTTADLHRTRTPRQVQLAYAAGYSRPVVESMIASLLSRGAGHLRYKGAHGARVQLLMAVMAHNAATVRRIRHGRLTPRAQKFRRLLHLKSFNLLKNRE
ncbi:MAG: transposase [Candidatus Tectomicrobia bacterium]|uniref:Transposase n=1 Tax=Tectimicrobiota bacterium TaxID=2528274 RepID=A0A938B6T9_UNCTE|nr:transposase [Candidatus Tectomicrobia bacterium]